MTTIEFDLNQEKTEIQVNKNETFKEAINRYLVKHPIISFIANGNLINPEATIESQMTDLDKEKKTMKVIVDISDAGKKEKVIEKSKDIICPICKESCRIKIENYKIKLFDCINKHTTNNIKFEDFSETQNLIISDIICDDCKEKNLGNVYNKEFYKCLSCSNNLCLLCKNKHNTEHNIIKYEQKNYICKIHNDPFAKYCEDCKRNICFLCNEEHKEHKTIFFGDIIPNKGKIKNKITETKVIIESINKDIKLIIKELNEFSEFMEKYYQINNDILNNYDMRNKNYDMLMNLKEINDDNEIYKILIKINDIDNLNSKFKKIIDLYDTIFLNKVNKEINQNIPQNNIIQMPMMGFSYQNLYQMPPIFNNQLTMTQPLVMNKKSPFMTPRESSLDVNVRDRYVREIKFETPDGSIISIDLHLQQTFNILKMKLSEKINYNSFNLLDKNKKPLDMNKTLKESFILEQFVYENGDFIEKNNMFNNQGFFNNFINK